MCVRSSSRSGRKAALEYLDQYREPLVKAEEASHPKTDGTAKAANEASPADNTLLNSNDELYLRGKSSFVLWMLRDMLGDTAMQSALAKYRAGRGQGSELLSAAVADKFKARPGVVLRRLGLS